MLPKLLVEREMLSTASYAMLPMLLVEPEMLSAASDVIHSFKTPCIRQPYPDMVRTTLKNSGRQSHQPSKIMAMSTPLD
jgi:hypothetical protein